MRVCFRDRVGQPDVDVKSGPDSESITQLDPHGIRHALHCPVLVHSILVCFARRQRRGLPRARHVGHDVVLDRQPLGGRDPLARRARLRELTRHPRAGRARAAALARADDWILSTAAWQRATKAKGHTMHASGGSFLYTVRTDRLHQPLATSTCLLPGTGVPQSYCPAFLFWDTPRRPSQTAPPTSTFDLDGVV